MKIEKFSISGMTCASCQANITRNIEKLRGVEKVSVNLLANQMSVEYDEDLIESEDIEKAVTNIGYGACSMENNTSEEHGFRGEWNKRKIQAEEEQSYMKKRLLYSVVLLIPLMYIAMGHMVSLSVPKILSGVENDLFYAVVQMFISAAVLIINWHFYSSGFKAITKGVPNMDTLVAIGSGASMLYGVFAVGRMFYGVNTGDIALVHHYSHILYFESSAMILTLVTLGKYLEARSKSKTSDALGKLMDLAPKTTTVVRDGQEEIIPSEQVVAGDIVIIKPGESIPVDGIVIEGMGYVDQSAITGESIPIEKNVGDEIISATINKNGSFRFKASKVGDDTTLAQIIRLVDEAGNSKAPIARLADKVSGIFVPVVLIIALITGIGWVVAGYGFEFALNCAVSVLVISCPCALGLATPVAIMVGTGKAAEYGILVKSAESLEKLQSIDTVVLDKTGTITSGHPSVTDIIVVKEGMSQEEFLSQAASLEAGSAHPLAEAVIEKAKAENIIIEAVEKFQIIDGRGVKAEVNGEKCFAGNAKLMYDEGIMDKESSVAGEVEKLSAQGKTPLIFASHGAVTGIIAVADTIRETSREALSVLKAMGMHIIMLTGDNHLTAEAIRKELDIEEAISDVLPADKEACIRSLQEKGYKVAMVGDGINDAPALMRADIGIAIGAGTDVAIDSADVVLMKDSLMDVATAVKLSKSVVKNIRMNLFWAFFYNILGIPVAAGILYPAFGLLLSPMIGSAAMSLSSICVVTNALRLRFFKAESKVDTLQLEKENASDKRESNNENKELKDNKEDKDNMVIYDAESISELNESEDVVMKKVLVVDGMMCAHCQSHVEKALSAVDGVSEVVVNLESKEAIVQLTRDVSGNDLKNAVTEAGYTVLSCEEV
ncbi:Cu+-exporting ATPase [Hathewaya proteolytica DSM 3090]|uniref:Copper-exporting P-type ATPase n=1 Tax=Hathewaya proteolytica DSM 3090 TaxID=1121331 RepID=A0A1M6RID3_9CLOT|nr:heavy metal translocating P-type ATPase [Hathewaya proteolytica]SHK32190.1 Cu+-exporting ATPase [Hathewaya proteolytica DSM 3090]